MKLNWTSREGCEGCEGWPVYRANIGSNIVILIHRGIGGCESSIMCARVLIGKNISDKSFTGLRLHANIRQFREWCETITHKDSPEENLLNFGIFVEKEFIKTVLPELRFYKDCLNNSLLEESTL